MNKKIAKWVTPVGEYSIDEHLNVFIGFMQDFNAPYGDLQQKIIYVENKIEQDLFDYRTGLESQIKMLQQQLDSISLDGVAGDLRIIL